MNDMNDMNDGKVDWEEVLGLCFIGLIVFVCGMMGGAAVALLGLAIR